VLTDGVDLVDGRPAVEQYLGESLQVGQRDAIGRQCHQGRAAAGQKANYQVALGGVVQQFGNAPSAAQPGSIGDGMSRLDNLNRAGRGQAVQRVPMLDDYNAAV
jgi:uncharacterized protein YidB (DUF937 family)